MSVRVSLTTFFILFSLTLFAQNIRLSGKVTNDRSEPVVGASVKLSGTSTGTTTNVEGVYFLTLTTGKKYTLEITAIGYNPKSIAEPMAISL